MNTEREVFSAENSPKKELRWRPIMAATTVALIALSSLNSPKSTESYDHSQHQVNNITQLQNEQNQNKPLDINDDEKVALTAGIIAFYGWQWMTSVKAMENAYKWNKQGTYTALTAEGAALGYAIYKIWS